MKSTLKSLFDDGICPFEDIVPRDPQYRAINQKISGEKRYFIGKMSPDDTRRFEELEKLYSESTSIYACDCFIYGFRLGASLMIEVLIDGK